MTDLRQAAEMALEALEMKVLGFNGTRKIELAIEALESALAKPDETETLKRCLFQMQETAKALTEPKEKGCAECGVKASDGYALYCVKCSEPMREWLDLTDEEISQAVGCSSLNETYLSYFRKVIAKLKEKNLCR